MARDTMNKTTRIHRKGTCSLLVGLAAITTLAACASDSDVEGINNDPETTIDAAPATTTSSASQLNVVTDGDGPIGLAVDSDNDGSWIAQHSGDAQPYSGRLIVGAGGCFSVTDNDRPELVVFPENSHFTLRGERPSVNTPSHGELWIGEPVTFDAIPTPLSDVEGIPEQCARGAADTVRIVQD